MSEDSKLLSKRVLGTLSFPLRYFIAGFILGDEPLSRTELDNRIKENYPLIFSSFFSSKSRNYAYFLCDRSVLSLGLGEKTRKLVVHPRRGEEVVYAFRRTNLAEELQKYVHFWWNQELNFGISVSHYLAHFVGPTLDAPHNRAKLIQLLSNVSEITIEFLAQNLDISYDHLNRHVQELNNLGVLTVVLSDKKRGKYKNTIVKAEEQLIFIGQNFVSPILEDVVGERALIQDVPDSFSEEQLLSVFERHYSVKSH